SNDGWELWATNGIPICTATGIQEFFDITVDTNENSLIVAWDDVRNFPYDDIYAQKVDILGDTLWTSNGVAVCSAPRDQEDCTVVSDGAGGAIVCWEDYRYLVESDVFAQRIDASGAPAWKSDGEPVGVYFYHQDKPAIVTDSEHGALIFWHDYRNSSHYDLYGQRMTSDGLWGYPCPAIHSVRDVPGDQGGLVNVTWDASRLDVPPGDIDVYTVWRAIDALAAITRI
ncbi:MAG: hypothetical protein KAT30_07525, partial [Candidatus Krumholzibacteria bacterium]|nr:hypothetical protein [Candidatus Krumholzibacteria bacterium]